MMAVERNTLQLIHTKLNQPRIGHDFVSRPRLDQKLSQCISQPLTLVSAPAGYGKTTLVSAWLKNWDSPGAWLSLDERDSDLAAFLNYFLAAVQSIFPQTCRESALLLKSTSLPPVPLIAGSVLNELNKINQPFVLVLDDYHTIREKSIHEFLAELLRYPPKNMHLILITRHNPMLPVTRMRAQGTITEIRSHDLRLTIPEIAAVLKQMIKVDVDESTAVLFEEKTEGWVTALQLAVTTRSQPENIDSLLSILEVPQRFTFDYLMSEVFSHLPERVQEFLIQSSILDRLCLSLCETVVELDEPVNLRNVFQDEVLKNNLFLSSLDDERQWFRYHDLFQKFLQRQLKQQHRADEITTLHTRAGNWFAQNNLLEEALKHLLSAEDTTRAVQLVAQHRHKLMNRDQWQTLSRWLQLFPPQVIEAAPDLLMVEAWLKQMRTQLADLPVVLDRVEYLSAQSVHETDTTEQLLGEIDVIRAVVDYYSVEAESALVRLDRAQAVLPRDLQYVHNIVSMYAGYANQMAGNLNEVTDTISAGLLETPRNELNRTRLLITLSIVYWMEADLDNLQLAAKRCLKVAQKANSVLGLSGGEYFLGCAHYQRSDLPAAERHFRFVVERPYLTHGYTFAQASFGLASTYQALGRPDQAQQVADSTVDFMLKADNAFLLSVARAYQAELAARQGRLVQASRWASQASPTYKRQAMTGFYSSQLTLPKILLAQDTSESRRKAGSFLTELRSFVESIHNTRFRIELLVLQALLLQAQGDESTALDTLEQALTLAQPGGLVQLFVDAGPKLELLLGQLVQKGTEPAYIAQILAAFRHSDTVGRDVLIAASHQAIRPERVETLTNREMDVLLLLAVRKTNKEIAGELGISPETVKRHAVSIYRKLDVHNRLQAVAKARNLGILQ